MNISSGEAERIANKKETLSSIFKGEKCAIVSPGDLDYGTSRVHQSHLENTDINTEFFRQFEDALNWLNVSLDDLNNGLTGQKPVK